MAAFMGLGPQAEAQVLIDGVAIKARWKPRGKDT